MNTLGNTFTRSSLGDLVTTGEIFNDAGYALAFPRVVALPPSNSSTGGLHYQAFNQAILHLQEEGVIAELESAWIIKAHDIACAGGGADDTVQLQVINVAGLFFVTGGLMILGFLVGTIEYAMRAFMCFLSCVYALPGRVSEELRDAREEAAYTAAQVAEVEPTDHELFVDSVFDALEETQEVLGQIEKNLAKCVKLARTRA